MGLSLMAFAWVYNKALSLCGVEPPKGTMFEQPDTWYLTSGTGVSFRTSANIIDSIVFVMDFITLALVLDLMLQDGSLYPDLLVVRKCNLRLWWTETWGGWFRLATTWVLFLLSFWLAMAFVWNQSRQHMQLHSLAQGGGWFAKANNELTRALVYATQFFFDSLIVQQDWEFPTFENEMQIAALGTNIVFEGRFFNYFMMVGVAMVDMKCLFSTVLLYDPKSTAQFTDSEKIIWSVTDPATINSMSIATPTVFTLEERRAEGCFEDWTDEDKKQNPCRAYIREPAPTFHSDIDASIWGGFNRCCDERIQASYDGNIFQNDRGMGAVLLVLCLIPAMLSITMAIILGHFMATSRKEMCRRVVLTKMVAYRIQLEQSMDLGFKEMVALRNDCFNEYAWRNNSGSASSFSGLGESPVSVTEMDVEGGDEFAIEEDTDQKYPLKLKRPPLKNSPLLLVCHTGVYSIRAGLHATVKDLIQEIIAKGITNPLNPANIRLRIRPRGHLKDHQWLGSLLPPQEESNVCLFVHAKLSRHTEGDDSILDWPRRLAQGGFYGICSFIMRVGRGFRVMFCSCASCNDRRTECSICCGEAFRSCLRGGDDVRSPQTRTELPKPDQVPIRKSEFLAEGPLNFSEVEAEEVELSLRDPASSSSAGEGPVIGAASFSSSSFSSSSAAAAAAAASAATAAPQAAAAAAAASSSNSNSNSNFPMEESMQQQQQQQVPPPSLEAMHEQMKNLQPKPRKSASNASSIAPSAPLLENVDEDAA